ncbi:hypothetical protein [Thalassospira xiamenensis]|uniref:hypothetical protein n=1 Tax=Thalassospira xiamenensis TaxID=220697 RepID=UPI003AA924E3
MDVREIVKSLDSEIAARTSDRFGIKMGYALMKALAEDGLVTLEKFSIMGSGVFEHELPTYKRKYAVTIDYDMADYDFALGVARPQM